MNQKILLIIKRILYYYLDVFELRGRYSIKKDPFLENSKEAIFKNSDITIGIVKEAWHLHYYYLKACHELKISYKLLDLFSNNWYEEVLNSGVKCLIIRPSVQYGPWKEMFDNRIRLLLKSVDIAIFPDDTTLWFWESKLRTLEWFKVNNIPHIETYIFYNKSEAFNYVDICDFPIIYKANSGSGSSGVKMVKSRGQLIRLINRCFNKGIRTYRKQKLDKEHGFIILQRFMPNISEWRIIRIGNYYFGYEKIKRGSFHSGSQTFGYGIPPKEILNFVKDLSEKQSISFADFDIFLDRDGSIYLNEVQPYFGQKDDRELLRVDGVSGRLYYCEHESEWRFEPGEYCRNNLCNLRLTEYLKKFMRSL